VDSELRLGRDLVDQLLTDGEAAPSAAVRAQALGYDLERPHRVVVVEPLPPAHDNDEFCQAVRRAAREGGVGSLLLPRAGAVVLLADTEQEWPAFQGAIAIEVGGGPNRMGVGGCARQPASLVHSYRQALFVVKLMHTLGTDRATVFDDLGVYRLFSGIADADEIEQFAKVWLAPLLDYDAVHHSDIVVTLCRYLETGRRQDATANALNVHRSTLKYRLQRVSEISGHDLSDPDTCFNLQLACRAWQTLSAMRTG
jgi:DNA-binding PucR family transcriptional regulator